MTLQTGQQIITMHTMLNTSRSMGNQTRNFGHLMVYKMRNAEVSRFEFGC